LFTGVSFQERKGQAVHALDYARAGDICQMVALTLEMGYNFLQFIGY
jgi:hypothetical protein